jgi:hypothetical protein
MATRRSLHFVRALATVCVCLTGSITAAGADATPTAAQARMRQALDSVRAAERQDAEPKTKGGAEAWANALDADLPVQPDVDQLSGRAAKMYVDGLQHYYDYYASALDHRRELFRWQLFSSKLIFTIVVLLELAGIFLAGVQFFRDRGATDSTIEATLQGVKVSSRVLGVIILTISLVFFYLYLVYVYPIHEAIVSR